MLAYGGDEACQQTGQRVRLRPLTTKETPLPPMVGLRPIVVSRPTSFAECARLVNQPNRQHGLAGSKEHASRLKHAQPAHGKGAFELIPDSGNRSPLLSVQLPYGVNRIPDPTERGKQ